MPEEEHEYTWTFEFEGKLDLRTMLLGLILTATMLLVLLKPGLLLRLLSAERSEAIGPALTRRARQIAAGRGSGLTRLPPPGVQ